MGALHEGHLSLIHRARALAGPKGSVVVSIFVNPTQFGPNEDLSRYPRPIERDMALCKEAGVDLLYLPEAEKFYEPDHSIWVSETSLSTGLCGVSRPVHFRGVCTVVAKLFNLLGPDTAVFGKKDYQQLAILRRMVRDLNFQIKLVGVETYREADGLALSSRNQYLTPEQRAQAPVLRQALLAARQAAKGGLKSVARLRTLVVKKIGSVPLSKVDYVEVVDAETLAKPGPESRKYVIAVAVYFGTTRLIDNIEISVK